MNETTVGTSALAAARELEVAFLKGKKIPSCANCNGKARVCWPGRESQLVQFQCRRCGPRAAIFDSTAPVQCGRCGTAPTGLFPRGAQIQCCSCGACSAVFVGQDPAGALAAALDAWCRRAPVLPPAADDSAGQRRRGAAPDGFDDEGKGDVLELLSRLLVGGSYRMAKSAKMRKGNYIKAHKCASAVLQEALHGGRRGFRNALWVVPNRELPRR